MAPLNLIQELISCLETWRFGSQGAPEWLGLDHNAVLHALTVEATLIA
jgi:hypothetical protein